MKRSGTWGLLNWALIGATVGALVLASGGVFVARGADPIKIGFGMALTGGLSANGKPALLAVQIWKDDVNKRGGLLGRPVELVYYTTKPTRPPCPASTRSSSMWTRSISSSPATAPTSLLRS